MPDDAALLQRYLAEGSEEAFTELVDRHLPLVRTAALRQLNGDEHASLDVAQIVFSELASNARRLTGHPFLAGWLYVATRNHAVKHVRTENRRRAREAAIATDPTESSPADAHPGELAPLLDRLVCELRPRERESLLLRYFENRSYGSIALLQHSTEDAARMRVTRALGRLREKFDRLGVASSAAALEQALGARSALAASAGLSAKISATAIGRAAAAKPSLLSLLMNASKTKLGILGAATIAGLYVWTSDARARRVGIQELQRLQASLDADVRRAALPAPAASQAAGPSAAAAGAEADAAPAFPRTGSLDEPPLGMRPQATALAPLALLQGGAIQWDGEPVTLAEFLEHLKAFRQAHPERTAQVLVTAQAAPASTLAYVYDEARKAGIQGVWLGSASLSPLSYGPRSATESIPPK